MSNGPLLAISVVSHQHDALLRPLLDDIAGLSEQLPIELLLTENVPGKLEELATQAGVRYQLIRNSEPRGFGANHNAAFALSRAPYFAVLNPDLRLLSDQGLSRLVDQLKTRPGVAGPRVLAPGGTVEDSARHVPTMRRLVQRTVFGRRAADYDPSIMVQSVDWLAGMCLVFDRESYTAVGGFDERYHLYCEDVDVCLRLHLAGRSVSWVQSAAVVHDAQRRTRVDARHFRWHLASMMRLMTSVAYWRYRS